MKRLLIVTPRFVPVNAADMQRARMSLPFFREFGWEPQVLAVSPEAHEVVDPVLAHSIPESVPIDRVRAIPSRLTRRIGLGDIALRGWPALYRAGVRALRSGNIDLIYFSTTAFFSMPLGRVWRRRFNVPYVLDIQDPWLSDYYETHPESTPPPKYALARRLHSILEPWTMARVSGLIAVSDAYIATLRRRYSWITEQMCATIPFSASEYDAALLSRYPQQNPIFTPRNGSVHAVYVGRAGDDMAPALRILFEALQRASSADASVAALRLHFVGTDYATDDRARKTVKPIADACGVGAQVDEQTGRVPYFQALQLLQDADLLLLVGSDDPQYSASKVYPYLLTGKPLVAVVHQRSSLVPLLKESNALVVTFGDEGRTDAVTQLAAAWPDLAAGRIGTPKLTDRVSRACSAREMTRQQCVLFDRIAQQERGTA